jgi:membrane fusion protein, multidrug efflux system
MASNEEESHGSKNTRQDQGSDTTKDKNEDSSKDQESEKPRSKKPLVIVAAVVVVLALIGFVVWFARRNEVTTDDAYTDGNVVTREALQSTRRRLGKCARSLSRARALTVRS